MQKLQLDCWQTIDTVMLAGASHVMAIPSMLLTHVCAAHAELVQDVSVPHMF